VYLEIAAAIAGWACVRVRDSAREREHERGREGGRKGDGRGGGWLEGAPHSEVLLQY